MPAARIVALPFFLLLSGCIGMERVPPSEPPSAGAMRAETVAVEPPEPGAIQAESGTVTPAETRATRNEAITVKPPGTGATQNHKVAGRPAEPGPTQGDTVAVPPAKPGATEGGGVAAEPVARPATIDTPAAGTPRKVAASPARAEQSKKKESAIPAPVKPAAPAAAAAAKPSPPQLDLALLEKRLKETNAVGVFTKLTLKNQVDDLLDRFRAYYQGRTNATLTELRQPYDMLILKVLSLLQDSDPSLATEIASSREAIWGILSDREKFAKL